MSTVSYYTAEGLKKLREELNYLKDVERPRASQAIGEARDKGDLSENAEYDAAKEAQGMLWKPSHLSSNHLGQSQDHLLWTHTPSLLPRFLSLCHLALFEQ